MTRVVLGNRHAIHSRDHGVTFQALPKGKRATVIDFDDDTSFMERLKAVTDSKGIWTHHAVGPDDEAATDEGSVVKREPIHAKATPAWVASDDPVLAAALGAIFGGIEVRELEDPYGGAFATAAEAGRAGEKRASGGSTGGAKQIPMLGFVGFMLMVPVLGWLLANLLPMLKTNAGNDFQYTQMATASASTSATGRFVGITANTTSPNATDTTLTGEITTAGGGLIRKAGTPAHTTGVASYTITTVFTANGTDSLPVTIGKRGIFDAVTAGNMIFESLVTPTATLSASGDALTLTDTVST